MADNKITILGAGLSALSIAYHLDGDDYVIYEKDNVVGGHCRTKEREGFFFDYGGHIFYPKQAYVKQLVTDLLAENCRESAREAWIYSYDTYTRYPFQANLFGLPTDVVKDCLAGLHDAQVKQAECQSDEPPSDFLDFIYKTFGEGIAKHFMIPFNNKHWRVPLDQITLDWMGKFLPRPSFEKTLEGSLSQSEACIGQNSIFMYPKRGGIQIVCDKFAERVNPVHFNSEVTEIDVENKTFTINGKDVVSYDTLISTLPLPVVVDCLKDVPKEVEEAVAKLRWNDLYVVSVTVDKPVLTEKHRLYVSSPDLIFHKLAFFSSYAPEMSPAGKSAVSAEVVHSKEHHVDMATVEERVVADLKKMDIIAEDDKIMFTDVINMPYAYAIYDSNRSECVAIIRDYLASKDVFCEGRYGEWAYQNMEQNIAKGKEVAERLNALIG
ncbi:MAG: FAD-dependent oxidoreductase [Kiritimatiellae bacterium]|jgi:protoporphyrinogen oxidase|nr:FAD-dependent oxidoreductase [Kiritimatiellia bacterium]